MSTPIEHAKEWVLYLLECANGSFYAGITNDLAARLEAHASGRGAKYTRANRPKRLIGSRRYPDRASASRAEWRIKQLPRSAKLDYIAAIDQGENMPANTRPHEHARKPFRVSDAYLDWAHSSAAEEGQPLAVQIMDSPVFGKSQAYRLFTDPRLVAEIADVAELYVGGGDNDLRAASVRKRAVQWLRERGLSVKQALGGVAT